MTPALHNPSTPVFWITGTLKASKVNTKLCRAACRHSKRRLRTSLLTFTMSARSKWPAVSGDRQGCTPRYQRTPIWEIPIFSPYKYHGYTYVRGTPVLVPLLVVVFVNEIIGDSEPNHWGFGAQPLGLLPNHWVFCPTTGSFKDLTAKATEKWWDWKITFRNWDDLFSGAMSVKLPGSTILMYFDASDLFALAVKSWLVEYIPLIYDDFF